MRWGERGAAGPATPPPSPGAPHRGTRCRPAAPSLPPPSLLPPRHTLRKLFPNFGVWGGLTQNKSQCLGGLSKAPAPPRPEPAGRAHLEHAP